MVRSNVALALVTLMSLARALPAAATTAAPRLSALVPTGHDTLWVRVDPVSPSHPRDILAHLPGSPQGGRVSWNADRTRALVWFDPDNLEQLRDQTEAPIGDGRGRLYLVAPGGQVTQLPLPTVGKLREVGFDRAGVPTALTLAQVTLREDHKGRSYVDFEGKRYTRDSGAEGQPVLAHAFQWQADHRWRRVDTALSSDGWDYAMGVQALNVFRDLRFRAASALEAHPPHDELKDPRTLAALARLAPDLRPHDGDTWWRLRGLAAPVYCWSIAGEFTYATGRVAFGGSKPTWAPALPWGPRDPVAMAIRGPLLLLSTASTGGHARLYDTRTHKLLYKDDHARDVVFWPDRE